MTVEDFQKSLAQSNPRAGLTGALLGLWWDAKGDWQRAHEAALRGRHQSWFMGACLPASERRRRLECGILVQQGTAAGLSRITRLGVAERRSSAARRNSIKQISMSVEELEHVGSISRHAGKYNHASASI